MLWDRLSSSESSLRGLCGSRKDAAWLFLRLTNSDTKKALTSAALARKSITAVSDRYTAMVEDLWDKANKEALGHLTLVMQNNPKKSVATILARPDLKSALLWPYEQAANQSEELIREAWGVAEVDAVKMAKGEFKLLGEDWQGYETDEALLDHLVADLHANAKAMRKRYQHALNSDSQKAALESLTNDARARASFSTSTAVMGVSTQVRDSATGFAGLGKMWVSRLDDRTCTTCRDLHGTVVPPGQPFPTGAMKTYKDKPLYGPPRHPRCRCIVVPTKLKKSKLKNPKT